MGGERHPLSPFALCFCPLRSHSPTRSAGQQGGNFTPTPHPTERPSAPPVGLWPLDALGAPSSLSLSLTRTAHCCTLHWRLNWLSSKCISAVTSVFRWLAKQSKPPIASLWSISAAISPRLSLQGPRPAEPFYCATCFFIDKSGGAGWVGRPAVEGRKLLCWRTTKAKGQPHEAEVGMKR
jgi:hypothetical protein